MTLKMNHVHLKTKDPDETAQFYVDTLGAKIVSKNDRGGYRLDLHGLTLNVSDFLQEQKRSQKYGMEHIAIDTDELDVLIEKLKARGIHILEQTIVSGGRRVCFFEGPDAPRRHTGRYFRLRQLQNPRVPVVPDDDHIRARSR
jgi:catechol 2,3-dioxygenase-like lactoylglutathione lyase family enzyme